MKCQKCKYWGDGDGTGMAYDAGYMNYCKHPSIDGNQHPSYGVMNERKTMVYSDGTGASGQYIMTRYSFGCVLFEDIK